MAIGPVVTRGYGTFGDVNLVVTRGYVSGAAPTPTGTAGGGRMLRGGEPYYPGKPKKLEQVEKRIRAVTASLRSKEAAEQSLLAREALATSEALRARLARIEEQIVALELELGHLELMKKVAEENEMQEIAEVYLISRMFH